MRRYIEALFRDYYRRLPRNELVVSAVETREFAYQLYGGPIVRHKSFASLDELRSFLASKGPLHVYYSSALYERPDAEDMEGKGWLGADLVFDIDADHIESEACESSGDIITLECLEEALYELARLLDALREELGLRDHIVVFSGNRGFHVHVEDAEVRRLGPRERREVASYIKARGLKLSSFLVRGKGNLVSVAPIGNLKRIYQALVEIGVDVDRGSDLGELDAQAAARAAIEIDEVVTADVHRLIRLPGSLHGKTGLRVVALDKRDIDRGIDVVMDKAIAFRRGKVTVELTARPQAPVLGHRIAGDVATLPTYVAVYLALRGYARLRHAKD